MHNKQIPPDFCAIRQKRDGFWSVYHFCKGFLHKKSPRYARAFFILFSWNVKNDWHMTRGVKERFKNAFGRDFKA